jgi:hypothetical protein
VNFGAWHLGNLPRYQLAVDNLVNFYQVCALDGKVTNNKKETENLKAMVINNHIKNMC